MGERILVPLDDSDRAKNALTYAIETFPDATITAIHVINPSDYAAGGFESGVTTNIEQLMEAHEKQAEALLADASARASEAGVEIETVAVHGGPARRIIEYAEENDIDQIVIGSHGRTGASRILLGSVAETVTRRAPTTVTVVR